jgi:hypothetical protein
MLSPHVDIYDLDGRHLASWLRLLLPPGAGEPDWGLLFVDERHHVVHAVRAGPGAVDPATIELAGTSPAQLASVRRAMNVRLLVVLEVGAVARLHGEIEGHLRLVDDYPAQWLTILRALRRMNGHGIWMEPRLLDLIPNITAEPIQRTFELLVPDGSALLAYVFDARPPEVHASVIAVVEDGDISLVTTHLGIEDALPGPDLARSWRAQTGKLLSLVEERYAPPSIGLFVDRAAWQRILVGPGDQMAKEMAAGRLVFDPAPAWLRGLLGGAQVAAFATRSARNLARLVPSSARRRAAGLAQSAQERLKSSGAHPFALLGFDPIDLWHRVRAHYGPRTGSTRPAETR